jgi:hypothetical protein
MEKRKGLKKKSRIQMLTKFSRSRRALAIPVTYLILFVSTLGLISITYYFAVEKVNARSQTLKISTAKQDFMSLDENLLSVVGQPGSARKLEVADSGGKLNVQPSNSSIEIKIAYNSSTSSTVFNGAIGQIIYELPYVDSPDTGLYLKGDSRTVTNQSGSLTTQLGIRNGAEHAEILLRYRPTVSCAVVGVENGRSVNTVRIYVVNLNASESITLYGKVPLRISCESTQITSTTYTLSYSPEKLFVTSILDGTSGSVTLPISSTAQGAVIKVEVVQCNVKIARCVM